MNKQDIARARVFHPMLRAAVAAGLLGALVPIGCAQAQALDVVWEEIYVCWPSHTTHLSIVDHVIDRADAQALLCTGGPVIFPCPTDRELETLPPEGKVAVPIQHWLLEDRPTDLGPQVFARQVRADNILSGAIYLAGSTSKGQPIFSTAPGWTDLTRSFSVRRAPVASDKGRVPEFWFELPGGRDISTAWIAPMSEEREGDLAPGTPGTAYQRVHGASFPVMPVRSTDAPRVRVVRVSKPFRDVDRMRSEMAARVAQRRGPGPLDVTRENFKPVMRWAADPC